MPKISIREIDNTGSETLTYDDYCVLVPGIKFECKTTDEDCDGTIDGHYATFEAFKNKLVTIFKHQREESSIDEKFMDDIGFITACECLRNGLSIQYVGVYDKPNGEDLNKNYDYTVLFNEYTDKGKYDIRFISCGGLTANAAKKAALNVAATRGDAKAVLDAGEPQTHTTSGEFTQYIESWLGISGLKAECGQKITRKGSSGDSWTIEETVGRYGQLFAPQCTIKIYKAEVNKKTAAFEFSKELTETKVPASLIYLTTFGKHVITGTKKYNPWYAIAGSTRGVSPYSSITPVIDFGDADINILQVSGDTDNAGHVATNIICNIRPYGYVIWGSRSMQPLSKPESDTGDLAVQLTAASFANIREICTSIKKTLYRAGRRYTFEPNSDELWFKFKASITPLLEKMKADNGIRSYKVVKSATTKKALMVALIQIVPIEPVEDFDLTVEMTDTIDTVTE